MKELDPVYWDLLSEDELQAKPNTQNYKLDGDETNRLYVAKRKWRAGSRVLESGTGRVRIYIN